MLTIIFMNITFINSLRNDQCNPDWFPGKKLVYPMIAYSKKADGSHTKWSDSPNVGFADTLMVSTINI